MPDFKSTRITALITCYNRRLTTIACLEQLFLQILPSNYKLDVVLVDDGSSDGTSEAISEKFPDVFIIKGSGNLYWCGGMRMAWDVAALKDPDYYLLLNDDTILRYGALSSLIDLVGPPESRIIAVGTIENPATGDVIYGAINKRKGVLGIRDIESCDTFNANCVLIPRQVYQEIGNLYSGYTHCIGDIDYGLLASRRGIEIKKSDRFIGTCVENPVEGTWRDRSLSRINRFKLLQHPKGLPTREWIIFCRRNLGWKWPIRAFSPIIRILLGL